MEENRDEKSARPAPAGGDERRQHLLALLRQTDGPLRGSELAARLAVSRQVIVQDVAVLRAGGAGIIATPMGYVLPRPTSGQRHAAVVACRHGRAEVEDELNALVDLGVEVVDVVVEHPVYGEIRALLMLTSREDVRQFMRRLDEGQAQLLSALTGGVHLHTIVAPRPEALEKARRALGERGYLLPGGDPK